MVQQRRQAYGRSGDRPAIDLDEPINKETHDSLRASVKSKHDLKLPANFVASQRTLVQFYLKLQARCMEDIDMRLMLIGDDWVLTIQSHSKCKIAYGLELTLTGRDRPPKEKNIMPVQSALHYLMAVKAWVWTLALAGAYQVERLVNSKGPSPKRLGWWTHQTCWPTGQRQKLLSSRT